MAINVSLQNPLSGEIKFIKVGFSWTLFFFSTVLGIPLFARKLYLWGFTMLAINVASLVFPFFMTTNVAIANRLIFIIGQFAISIMLGIKGNEMTAKRWMAMGWRFTDPQSETSRYARMQWKIYDPISSPVSTTSGPTTPVL